MGNAGLFVAAAIVFSVGAIAPDAQAHDIYNGLHGRDSQLCCGGDGDDPDCARTHWKGWSERQPNGNTVSHYAFLTKNKPGNPAHWVEIPKDHITFLPVPGDAGPAADDPDGSHYGHLCYRDQKSYDNPSLPASKDHMFGDIWLYCAFIPPGSI